MKIYRIVEDVNVYQSFMVDSAKWKGDLLTLLTFDCSPRSSEWAAPPVYVLHPKLKQGNFVYLCPGALVVDAATVEQLRDLLEMSGELLPLPHKDKLYYVLNVTECINVLDEDMTEWLRTEDTGTPIGPKQYAFNANRLTETPLFKIPETCRSEILTCEGLKDPDDEFKRRVERLGLKGLMFEELWDSDN
jgi:hypothetical protein